MSRLENPLLPAVIPCFPLLPLSPLVLPCFFFLPLVTLSSPCYPWLLVSPVTPCYSLLILLPFFPPCYHGYPLLPPFFPVTPVNLFFALISPVIPCYLLLSPLFAMFHVSACYLFSLFPPVAFVPFLFLFPLFLFSSVFPSRGSFCSLNSPVFLSSTCPFFPFFPCAHDVRCSISLCHWSSSFLDLHALSSLPLRFLGNLFVIRVLFNGVWCVLCYYGNPVPYQ